MKKILFLSLLVITFLSGCRDDKEPAPGERPEERLSQALKDYKSQLVSAPHGWKAVLYPASGGGYNFYMKFKENDRVEMAADINAASATPMESTYRLKTMQRPSLIFDTYSYLHILTDPDETISGGARGEGLGSDFEFAFESATPETITLRGNFLGTRLVLTKATADEAANFITGISATARAFDNMRMLKTYFKRLTVGSNIYDVAVNTALRSITFTYSEGNVQKRFTTSYTFSPGNILLSAPFTANGITISELNGINYNATTNRINLTINGTAATIAESNRPAVVDVQGARELVVTATGDDYWITGGFQTVDNPDLYNVFSIPNLYFIAFWPKFSSNPAFDLLGFVLQNPTTGGLRLAYGPAATSRVTSDGRIIFTFVGNYEEIYPNIPPIPAADAPVVTATKNQWTDTEGYYFVRVSDSEAVLVSARNARIWMTLYR